MLKNRNLNIDQNNQDYDFSVRIVMNAQAIKLTLVYKPSSLAAFQEQEVFSMGHIQAKNKHDLPHIATQ